MKSVKAIKFATLTLLAVFGAVLIVSVLLQAGNHTQIKFVPKDKWISNKDIKPLPKGCKVGDKCWEEGVADDTIMFGQGPKIGSRPTAIAIYHESQ